MQPLIDADVLLYEVGFGCEVGWDEPGYPSFDRARELLESKIEHICNQVEATQPPILFLTGQGNFRYDIAKRTPYKARLANKPFHYKNIKAYIKGMYDYRESTGMEADDLMAIEQSSRERLLEECVSSGIVRSIICSRDKDLRQVEGWHYGWECNGQPSFGPMLCDSLGSLSLSANRKKLSGTGQSFFYAQCLMGDSVDSVPGLGGKTGPVTAFEMLQGCTSIPELHNRVLEAYRALYGDRGDEELLEQGRLLWMTRELNEDGTVKLWEFPIMKESQTLIGLDMNLPQSNMITEYTLMQSEVS